jgi:hypothetical protein
VTRRPDPCLSLVGMALARPAGLFPPKSRRAAVYTPPAFDFSRR